MFIRRYRITAFDVRINSAHAKLIIFIRVAYLFMNSKVSTKLGFIVLIVDSLLFIYLFQMNQYVLVSYYQTLEI